MGRKALQGFCNICGSFGNMTKDHVPPKGSVKITQMLSKRMVEAMGMEKAVRGPRDKIHQNGVTFPTLCGCCNNTLLGCKLDPEFNRFTLAVCNVLGSSMHLPDEIVISCDPSKIVRGFLGHMAAADTYDNSRLIREELGEFVMTGEGMPSDAKVYCWPFPYKGQTLLSLHSIAPDIARYGFNGALITWVMKFSPVAFMLVWKKPKSISLDGLTCISDFIGLSGGGVRLRLTNVHQHWPEAPGPSDVILSSSKMTSIKSFPYQNKKSKGHKNL